MRMCVLSGVLVAGLVVAPIGQACEIGDASRAASEQISQLAVSLDQGIPAEQDKAARKLLELQQALLEAMAYGSEDSAEAQARSTDLLSAAAAQARMAHAMRTMPAEDRRKLERFREQHPQIVKMCFAPEPDQVVEGFRLIGELGPSAADAEPLVLLGLRHPWSGLAGEAARTAEEAKLGSPRIVRALTEVIVANWEGNWDRSRKGAGGEAHIAAVSALGNMGTPRSAGALMVMLRECTPLALDRKRVLAEALGRTGCHAAIPHLMDMLDQTREFRWTYDAPELKYGTAGSDMALIAVLELTGQDPRAYGFIRPEPLCGYVPPYGFRTEEDRTAAIEKIRTWWAEHENDEPYRSAEPLELPVMRVPREVVSPAAPLEGPLPG